jgi:hypothetical protein
MNRQNYQQIGFIIALVIAGVSLPTSIISLTREPNITNNYFNDAYYNQTYYNQTYYENNQTTVNVVRIAQHSLTNNNFEAIPFDYSEGDKMIAVWDCITNDYVDVYFMNKENFQLFIDGLSFTTVLSVINTTSGFIEYEIIVPNLYFTVFYANYSNAWFNSQVTQYCL